MCNEVKVPLNLLATLAQSDHAKKDISIVIRMHKNFIGLIKITRY